MRTLFDVEPDPPAQRHSEPSVAAATAIRPDASRLRAAVLAAIAAAGGLTDEEGIDHTGLSPSTYRPRRVELVQAGAVADSGTTRPTRSGRKAAVWVAVQVPSGGGV